MRVKDIKSSSKSAKHPGPALAKAARQLEAGTQIVLSHKGIQLLGRWRSRIWGPQKSPSAAMAEKSPSGEECRGPWGNHGKSLGNSFAMSDCRRVNTLNTMNRRLDCVFHVCFSKDGGSSSVCLPGKLRLKNLRWHSTNKTPNFSGFYMILWRVMSGRNAAQQVALVGA